MTDSRSDGCRIGVRWTSGATWRLAAVLAASLANAACRPVPASQPETAAELESAAQRGGAQSGSPARLEQAAGWTAEDWDTFQSKVRLAASERLDTLPLGEGIARLAVTFVGATYTPGTLEAEGPESLVINFRELDCVTFVETILALTRFVRQDGVALLEDRDAAEAAYERYLTDLRYRDGVIDGYPSRLHYFSEWLTDNVEKGLLGQVTGDLDPAVDPEPIDFMSEHPDAYRQLSDPAVLRAIEAMEARLNADAAEARGGRLYVPQERIAAIAPRIQDGDVIAATSTVEGLDVAHTGLAVWIEGRLHLVHAPLVGKEVEISEVPLADRIQRISGQDGIMVARPSR